MFTVCFHQSFSRTFLVLLSRLFYNFEAFKSNVTSDWAKPYGLAQSEVVLLSNLQNLKKKKDKNDS